MSAVEYDWFVICITLCTYWVDHTNTNSKYSILLYINAMLESPETSPVTLG